MGTQEAGWGQSPQRAYVGTFNPALGTHVRTCMCTYAPSHLPTRAELLGSSGTLETLQG